MLFIIVTTTVHAQQYVWAGRGGGDFNFQNGTPQVIDQFEHIRDIVVDSQNNYYFLAIISTGNTTLNGLSITNYNVPTSGKDTFLFSTDCNGNIRWKKTIGGEVEELTQHLSIDSNDNIYISGFVIGRGGNTSGFIHFDTDVIINTNLTISTPGPHNKSLYLIKYDRNGVFQWLTRPQQDATGIPEWQKSYTMGHYTDANNVTHWLMTMGAGTHINGAYTTTTDNYAIFRFDATGAYLGQTPVDMVFTNGRPAYGATLTMDETLNRYYVSAFIGIGGSAGLNFLGNPVTNWVAIGAIDAVTGNVIWRLENAAGRNGTLIRDIKVDSQSNIYITGEGNRSSANGVTENLAGHIFTHTNAFGTPGGPAPYLIKLNSQGNLIWGSNPNFGSLASGYKIALNGNEVAIAAGLRVTGNWGTQPFARPAGSQGDPVVVRFDTATGNVLGIEDIKGLDGIQDEATAIATDNFGNYVVGGFMGNTLFQNTAGITPLVKNGGGATDFWYAKLATTDCAGVPLSIEEEHIDKVSVFPNPAREQVHITSNMELNTYAIYNNSGQLMLSGKIDATKSVNVLPLKAGIYFLKVYSAMGVHVVKLIKE